MHKTDSFYSFLEDLVVKQDGSFDYDITKRILDKYKKVPKLKAIVRRNLGIFTSSKREAA